MARQRYGLLHVASISIVALLETGAASFSSREDGEVREERASSESSESFEGVSGESEDFEKSFPNFPSPRSVPETEEEEGEVEVMKNRRTVEDADDIGRLVEEAFENGELLDREHWSRGRGFSPSKITVQRDTEGVKGYQEATVDGRFVSSIPQFHPGQTRHAVPRRTLPRSNERMQADGQIVFPDDRIDRPQRVTPDSVPVCEGSNFCEHTPYYPKDLVDQALQRNESLKLFASVDVDIGERIDTMDDISLCASKVEVVYPVSAKKDDNEWVFVVNQDNFKQGVRVETCRNTSSPCSLVENSPAGYQMTCKQQYISRQLMSVDEGHLAPRYFQFPASCCCHAKFVGNARARIQGDTEESLDSTGKKH